MCAACACARCTVLTPWPCANTNRDVFEHHHCHARMHPPDVCVCAQESAAPHGLYGYIYELRFDGDILVEATWSDARRATAATSVECWLLPADRTFYTGYCRPATRPRVCAWIRIHGLRLGTRVPRHTIVSSSRNNRYMPLTQSRTSVGAPRHAFRSPRSTTLDDRGPPRPTIRKIASRGNYPQRSLSISISI